MTNEFPTHISGFQRLFVVFCSLACPLHFVLATPPPADNFPNSNTAEIVSILDRYRTQTATAEEKRKSAVTEILARHLTSMNSMLAEKKKSRNITGIAVATAGIDIFQTSISNVAAGGSFEPPDNIRRELETIVQECKASVTKEESSAAHMKDQALKDALQAYRAVAARSSPPLTNEAALKDRLLILIQQPSLSQSAPDPSAAMAGSATTNKPSSAAPELPLILAASGDSETWYPIASWHAAMMGMDIITIPVFESPKGTNVTRQLNPMSGQNSELQWIVHHSVMPMDGMLFRLKRAAKREAVDVLEWPSRANGYKLVVRTPATERYPSLHGFDLEIANPGFAGSTLDGIRPAQSDNKLPLKTVVSIVTAPEGAAVYVNGVIQPKVRTPCRIPLPSDIRSLILAMPGYAPLVLTNGTFPSGHIIRWNFAPDPRIQRANVTVAASAKSWQSAGVHVNEGDQIVLQPQGQWSCGSGKELCDASGYPNNQTFYRYYMDPAAHPRHTSTANYGALVARIGDSGRIVSAASARRFKAGESGHLLLDINESDTGMSRSDNSGSLIVNITVIPSQPLLPDLQ